MTKTKHTFGSTKALREHLVSLGFPAIRSGQTRGEFIDKGIKANWGMYLAGKTGQSSQGGGWNYILTIEEVGA